MANSDVSVLSYRLSYGSLRSFANAIIRSACSWPPWCFHSVTYACGRLRKAGFMHSGTPRNRSA